MNTQDQPFNHNPVALIAIAIVIGLALAMLTGCAGFGIDFRSDYGNARYDGQTATFELPKKAGYAK